MDSVSDRPADLKRVLAEEVRAAIAHASPAPAAPAPSDAPAADSRVALRRAEEVLTPSVPADAPLSRWKNLAIRALRFLWRNQSSFNALSLTATSGLAEGLDRLRAETARELDELGRRAGIQESRLTLVESPDPFSASRAPAAAVPAGGPAAAALPPGVYALFEERFRGSSANVVKGQRFYLDFVKGAPGPVLDVGSGRGEFLRLLRDAGIAARGVESNAVSAEASRASGLDVETGDALEVLGRLRPGSLGAVVAFQVVEHWPPGEIFRFLQQARRAVAPGGVLIVETINPDSLSALRAFHLDPTHVRPVPAEMLRFLAEAAGFSDLRIEYRSPLPASERLEEKSDNDRRLNALLFGPQDYALVGRAPVPS